MYLVDTTKSHCSKFDNNFSIIDYLYALLDVQYLPIFYLCKHLSENIIFGKLQKKERLMIEINLWILPNKCYVNAYIGKPFLGCRQALVLLLLFFVFCLSLHNYCIFLLLEQCGGHKGTRQGWGGASHSMQAEKPGRKILFFCLVLLPILFP